MDANRDAGNTLSGVDASNLNLYRDELRKVQDATDLLVSQERALRERQEVAGRVSLSPGYVRAHASGYSTLR